MVYTRSASLGLITGFGRKIVRNPYGIVIGDLDQPAGFVGIRGRPSGGTIRCWLANLHSEGCDIRVVPARAFQGSFLECVATGECDRRAVGRCPLDL